MPLLHSLDKFQRMLQNTFPNSFCPSDDNFNWDIDDDAGNDSSDEDEDEDYDDDDDDDDADAPTVVSIESVDAAMNRNAALPPNLASASIPEEIRKAYPILAAAVQPQEDIVMTCARALDEANDVSLVREAAEYLEQVEKKRKYE